MPILFSFLILILLLFFYYSTPNKLYDASYIIQSKTLGLWVCISAFLPTFIYLNKLRSKDANSTEPIPFVPIIGLIYGVYYGLPLLFGYVKPLMKATIDPTSLEKSLWLALIGWYCFLIGYYFTGQTVPSRPLKLQLRLDKTKPLAFV